MYLGYYERRHEDEFTDESGYQLDIPYWDLTEEQNELLNAVKMLIDYKMSIRQTERETGIPKSTLHDFIHQSLQSISYEIHQVCIHQLKWNKQNIRHFLRPRNRYKQYHKR